MDTLQLWWEYMSAHTPLYDKIGRVTLENIYMDFRNASAGNRNYWRINRKHRKSYIYWDVDEVIDMVKFRVRATRKRRRGGE